MFRLPVMLVAVIISAAPILADAEKQFVHSYSMEEMYSMATYYKAMREGEELDDLQKYMKAAEFRGYVAAALDEASSQDNEIKQCVRTMRVNDIAHRAAVVITSIELDRSAMSPLSVNLGIRFACDESRWNADG